MTDPLPPSFDAYAPREIAARVRDFGLVKARLALMFALGAGLDADGVRSLFAGLAASG